MQNQKIIEKLGYSPNEAKVYLAALALGEASISDIADRVKMPRSTVQVIVERLHETGLMNFYVMRRYKYWVAEDPAELLRQIEQHRALAEEAIPGLLAIKEKARRRQKVAKQQEDLGPLREMADGMGQPVLITNRDGEIQYVNEAWEQQFGYTGDEMYGQATNVLRSGQTPPAEYERLQRAVKAGALFESDAIVDQKKNGQLFSMFTTIFPVNYGNRTFFVQVLEERPAGNGKLKQLKQRFVKAAKGRE